MPHTLITPTLFTRECLRLLVNNLVFTKYVNRDPDIVGGLADTTAKIGDTYNVRRSVQIKTRATGTYSAQDIIETSVPLKLDKQYGFDFEFTSKELTLTIDRLSDRYLKPGMAQLANDIDAALAGLYKKVWNSVGTVGTTPATFADVLAVTQKLDECGVPRDDTRQLVVNPAANAKLADGLKGLFNPTSQIGDIVRKGMFAAGVGGFDGVLMDQNIKVHTTGPLGSTPVVNTSNQGITTGWAEYTDLVTDGWTAAAAARLNAGDVITLGAAGANPVYQVNPRSKQSTGRLQQFVCSDPTADDDTTQISSDGSGNLTVRIRPAIISGGAYQTVDSRATDTAAITVVGTTGQLYPVNLGFHRDWAAFLSRPLEVPRGVHFAAAETYEGISMRVVQAYDLANDKFPLRVDVLFGVKAIYPDLACRLVG